MPNRLNILVVAFASLGSLTWGYNAGIIASTLGQPNFYTYMKLDDSNTASLIGAANGMFSVGGFLGCYLSVWLNESSGRLKAILLGALLTTLGAGLSAGSVAIPMFIVARFISGLGVGNLLVLVPLYQSEVSPHTHRGLYVGLHGVMLCFGYVTSSWIGYGFFFVTNERINWRMPLAIGGIPCAILAIWVLRLPESPRWLVERGRIDDARAVLRRLRTDAQHPDTQFAEDELYQMIQQNELDKEAATSWMSMVTLPHYRKRSIIGFLTLFFVQCSGSLVITNYAPILYGKLGYDTNRQLLLAGGYITMCPFGNMLNAYLLDIVGRKKLLSFGLYGCVLMLCVEAGAVSIFSNTGSNTAASVAAAFLFVHMFAFCTSQDASSYVYVAEIFPTHIRAKGVAISVSGLFMATIILVSAAPTGFDAIGWKYYLVLIIPAFIGATAELIWWPETCRMPLEEVAKLWGDPVAVELGKVHADHRGQAEQGRAGAVDEKSSEERVEFSA